MEGRIAFDDLNSASAVDDMLSLLGKKLCLVFSIRAGDLVTFMSMAESTSTGTITKAN
jgi:hypothetical protein